jgi:glycyl-tRNA synthetase beta chain
MQPKAAEDLRRLMTDGPRGGRPHLRPRRRLRHAPPPRPHRRGAVRPLPPRPRGAQGPRHHRARSRDPGLPRSTGLTLDQLERRQDKKGETSTPSSRSPGREAAEIVAEVWPAVSRLPWPKSMRWGSGSPPLGPPAPVHPLPPRARGRPRGRPLRDRGPHGGEHHPRPPLPCASGRCRPVLRGLRGEAEARPRHPRPDERRDRIRHDAATLAFARGLEVVEDEGLLTEAVGLVEWPVTLMGSIEEQFLGLPPRCCRPP